MEISGGGGEGVQHQGFQSLWTPPGDGELIQIPGTGDLGGGRQLDGGGKELLPDKGSLEENASNPQQVRGGAAGVRLLF